MENQGFVKSSQLTGAQKAAILLAEIGPAFNNQYSRFQECLNLNPKEMKKLRLAMKSLPLYLRSEPKNIKEIYREQDVLEALLNFCEARGIYNPKDFEKEEEPAYLKNDRTGVGKLVAENPNAIARIIGNWLDN